MNRIVRDFYWIPVFGLIFLLSVASVSSQRPIRAPIGPLMEDTAKNPHDFTNEYYEMNGITAKTIVNRRTGADGLSVFSHSSNPYHTQVRVTATIPAYDQNGSMLFWYPLGDVPDNGFTPDKIGWEAEQLAKAFPIYIFPHSKLTDRRLFSTTRQAALIDNSWPVTISETLNPLGLRSVVFVSFTDKAFTKEGAEMMSYMETKNGLGADDTPILRTIDDIRMMVKYDLVSLEPAKYYQCRYAIAPTIDDPTDYVIAYDAFLWFATKDGTPLPSEEMFLKQFACLQKTGNWCGK